MDWNYIVSEKFIHVDLLRSAEAAVQRLREIWARDQKISPTLITWPGEKIKDDNGATLDGLCVLDLPADNARWPHAMRAMVERTHAYALLLIEEQREAVKVIFESPHGTRSWTFSIRRSGDVRLLGDVVKKDDVESVGFLWRKKRAQS